MSSAASRAPSSYALFCSHMVSTGVKKGARIRIRGKKPFVTKDMLIQKWTLGVTCQCDVCLLVVRLPPHPLAQKHWRCAMLDSCHQENDERG